jgi:hypothetical protein
MKESKTDGITNTREGNNDKKRETKRGTKRERERERGANARGKFRVNECVGE